MVLLSREGLPFRRKVAPRVAKALLNSPKALPIFPKVLPIFPKALLIVHEYAE